MQLNIQIELDGSPGVSATVRNTDTGEAFCYDADDGWIPEAVYTTASVTPGRKSSEYEHESFGLFSFQPLATQRGYFLELVERVQSNEQTMFVAKPIRALMDLVCARKVEWQGMAWLTESLRIEYDLFGCCPRLEVINVYWAR